MKSPPRKGGIHVVDAPSIRETYVDILARHGLPEITADGERDPQANGASPPPNGSFAAWFAEIRVDADLGLLRVARIVSAVDAGRILNENLARSQIIGGAAGRRFSRHRQRRVPRHRPTHQIVADHR
jgi:xanthine dehydrogenase YagR molybdenum-binding subunit